MTRCALQFATARRFGVRGWPAVILSLGTALVMTQAVQAQKTATDAATRVTSADRLSRESDTLEATRRLLVAGFWQHETRRYVILSEADATTTQLQGARLEQVHQQFERFARQLDLAPKPLRHKLVCVLFNDRTAYRDFALAHDDVTAQWIAGYYAPAADRIVFTDVEASEGLPEVRTSLREMADDIGRLRADARTASLRGQAAEATRLNTVIRDYQAHLDREQARVDQFADSLGVATTIHEATHQLMFHTGVQSSYVTYPLWLCEGLATCFETDDAALPFGPDRDYESRRRGFVDLLASEALMPLESLVVLTNLPDDDETLVRRVYHQSYALVMWMSRYRRAELATYLVQMRREPSGSPTARRHRELFEQAFGDLASMERAWLRHERRLADEHLAAAQP